MSGVPVTLDLALLFGGWSLLAIGGAQALLPEIHAALVESRHWLTGAEFAQMYALAQAAPGPNVLFVSLFGWRVNGIPGALVATIAMCGPSSVCMYYVSRAWTRFRDAEWRKVVQAGLNPVTVGLVLASGATLVRTANESNGHWSGYIVSALAAAILFFTRRNPLWVLGGAALLGMMGVV